MIQKGTRAHRRFFCCSTNLGIELTKVKIDQQLSDLLEVEALLKELIAQYPEIDAFRAQLVAFYVKAPSRQG